MNTGWYMPELDSLRAQSRAEYELWLATELPSRRNPAPPPETQGATMTTMNYSTAIFLVNDAVRAVATSYERDKDGKGVKPWVLYKTMDDTLAVGDLVVVPTDTRHCRTVVRIEELDVDVDPGSSVQMTWVVDRVDETAFKAMAASEAAGIEKIKSAEKRKLREELQAKLLADNPDVQVLGNIGAARLPHPPPEPEPYRDPPAEVMPPAPGAPDEDPIEF